MRMNYGLPQFAIHVALMAFIFVSGCQQKPTAYGIAESESCWTTNITDPDTLPGIDAASVSFITLQAGPLKGVPFVVWSDLPNGGSGSGGGRVGGASYKGYHRVLTDVVSKSTPQPLTEKPGL